MERGNAQGMLLKERRLSVCGIPDKEEKKTFSFSQKEQRGRNRGNDNVWKNYVEKVKRFLRGSAVIYSGFDLAVSKLKVVACYLTLLATIVITDASFSVFVAKVTHGSMRFAYSSVNYGS
jgi:hypothetical protein